MTAIPPKRPASAVTAASWTFGSIVVRTADPAFGSLRASTRPPAFSVPPGVPASRSSKVRSRPLSPTGVPSGTPRRASSSSRSGGAGPSRPAISDAIGPRSERRCSPCAMIVPSRAWSAARGGIRVSRFSRSPSRRPGNTCSGLQAMPGVPSCSSSSTASVRRLEIEPKIRVANVTSTSTSPPSRTRGRVVRTADSVAVSAARS